MFIGFRFHKCERAMYNLCDVVETKCKLVNGLWIKICLCPCKNETAFFHEKKINNVVQFNRYLIRYCALRLLYPNSTFEAFSEIRNNNNIRSCTVWGGLERNCATYTMCHDIIYFQNQHALMNSCSQAVASYTLTGISQTKLMIGHDQVNFGSSTVTSEYTLTRISRTRLVIGLQFYWL